MILFALAIWVAISGLLVVLWARYRRLLGWRWRVAYDVPREPTPKPVVHR